MSLLKFVLYSLIAYLVIRFVMRIINPPKQHRPKADQNQRQTHSDMDSLEKPKFTIEAESVDYEVIESEEKDEK